MQISTYSIDVANKVINLDNSEVKGLVVSDPIVMMSAAGWYVGRICRDEHDYPEMVQPYSRETGYMSEQNAIETLHRMNQAEQEEPEFVLWADGTSCHIDELYEYGFMSDDYQLVYEDPNGEG